VRPFREAAYFGALGHRARLKGISKIRSFHLPASGVAQTSTSSLMKSPTGEDCFTKEHAWAGVSGLKELAKVSRHVLEIV